MPKSMRTISCCYCDASTLVDLSRIGRGVLTCDACGARLSSARMEALVNKPVPIKRTVPKRAITGGTLDQRWQDVAGPSISSSNRPKKKSRPRKRKSFLDRLEDIWEEIEDIID